MSAWVEVYVLLIGGIFGILVEHLVINIIGYIKVSKEIIEGDIEIERLWNEAKENDE